MAKNKSKKNNNSNDEKMVLIVSDFHCGHNVGLTPPEWRLDFKSKNIKTKRSKYCKIQGECWNFIKDELKQLGKPDICIANGDLIDGRGEMSGGTELITVDRQEQCDMAVDCLKMFNADRYVLTYGTAYHVGKLEDYENLIAEKISAESIGSHEWIDVNGIIFDVKHHIGSSGIPHGRYTAIAKDRLWNTIWAQHEEQPKSDIIVRSHVHYMAGSFSPDWMGFTTPALQAMGSKYGSRRCSGTVDFGFVVFYVKKNGEYRWESHIAKIKAQQAKTIKL